MTVKRKLASGGSTLFLSLRIWPRAELSRSTHQAYGFAYDKTAAGGRFTQVDPIGQGSSSIGDPQSLNLYTYVGNDPINRIDPSGLFWGKLFRFLKKLFKILAVVVAVALAVVAVWIAPGFGPALVAKLLIMSGLTLASQFGPRPVRIIIGFAGLAFGIYSGGLKSLLNFSGSGGGGSIGLARRLAPWLAGLGAVTSWQQQQQQGKDEPAGPIEDVIVINHTESIWDRSAARIAALLLAVGSAIASVMSGRNDFDLRSSGKNPYGPCDSFLQINERYIFRNAPDSRWGRYVRGRLVYERARGVGPFGRHLLAYSEGTIRHPLGAIPGTLQVGGAAAVSGLEQTGQRIGEGIVTNFTPNVSGVSVQSFPCRNDVP